MNYPGREKVEIAKLFALVGIENSAQVPANRIGYTLLGAGQLKVTH